MDWEQQISDLLQQAQSIAVRFDVNQELTTTQRNMAKNNIGVTTTVTNVSGNDYKIALNY